MLRSPWETDHCKSKQKMLYCAAPCMYFCMMWVSKGIFCGQKTVMFMRFCLNCSFFGVVFKNYDSHFYYTLVDVEGYVNGSLSQELKCCELTHGSGNLPCFCLGMMC